MTNPFLTALKVWVAVRFQDFQARGDWRDPSGVTAYDSAGRSGSGCMAGDGAFGRPNGSPGSEQAARTTRRPDRAIEASGNRHMSRVPGLPSVTPLLTNRPVVLSRPCKVTVVSMGGNLLACVSGFGVMRAARLGGLASSGSCPTCRGFLMRTVTGLPRLSPDRTRPGHLSHPGRVHGTGVG